MAFYKTKQQKEEKQIDFKNIGADIKFNPYKKYYAIVEVDGKEKVYTPDVPLKWMNEAHAYFDEAARLDYGRVKYVGVLK